MPNKPTEIPLTHPIYDDAGNLLLREGMTLTPRIRRVLASRGVTVRKFAKLSLPGSLVAPIRIDAVCKIGRSKSCNLVLADSSVSSKHCCISIGSDTVVVEDLDSTNGTRINGRRIAKDVLAHGDTLRLGDVSMTVELGAEVQVEAGFEGVMQEIIDLGLGITRLGDPTVAMDE